ncbi:MAG: SURF1 family protein [Paracoccaceae bacterium]
MMRRGLFPLVLGFGGCAVLVALGVWQVQRLAWKEAVLAEIAARIVAPPEALPAAVEAGADPPAMRFRPVRVAGRTTGDELRVLTGRRDTGAGYEIIAAFETGQGRRVLLDRGYVAEGEERAARPPVALEVTGNLHWPDEADGFTPPPDMARGLWFARDVPAMAAALGTEPILVVAREVAGDRQGIDPSPVGTEGISSNHRQYAITWFSLAAVWAGMTAYLMWRIRRKVV